MALVIGIPKETVNGENRVALVPELVGKFKSLGADIYIEHGAGSRSNFPDEQFKGALIVADSPEIYARAQVILKVQPPSPDEILAMRPGTILAGFPAPL